MSLTDDYMVYYMVKIVEALLIIFLLGLLRFPLQVVEYKQTTVILLNIYFRLR